MSTTTKQKIFLNASEIASLLIKKMIMITYLFERILEKQDPFDIPTFNN
jgi:hypothetical protein